MLPRVRIPEDLVRRYRSSGARLAWLDALPDTIDALLDRWGLQPDLVAYGEPWSGSAAIVVPVRTATGQEAALKISYPFDEALLEPLALGLWNGHGAVRMLRSSGEYCAMLLERLDGNHSLIHEPMPKAIEVWGSVVKLLSITPDERADWGLLPHIAATAEQWSDSLPERWELLGRPFPRWVLEAALEVCQTRGAVGRRSGKDVLVHTDLHYLNILFRLDADGFAAIDAQPQVGEAEFAVAPALWNRIPELDRREPGRALLDRSIDLCAAANLDPEVARQWSVAREVDNALSYLEKSGHESDAMRSLWVASTMSGKVLDGLPLPHELKVL